MLGLKMGTWGGAVGALALAAGCGGQGSGGLGAGGTGMGMGGAGGESVMVTSGDYQPLVLNATWSYHVNDKGPQYDKTVVVEALEDVGGPKAGTMAYRFHETIPSEYQMTWYQAEGEVVVRYHEQSFDPNATTPKSDEWCDPYRLRIDESAAHTAAGASWDWMYMDTKTSRTKPTSMASITESWTVDAVDEAVTVPAGTFAALRLTHVDPSDGSTKTYWFVRGIGKVREQTNAGHIEELTSYTVPK